MPSLIRFRPAGLADAVLAASGGAAVAKPAPARAVAVRNVRRLTFMPEICCLNLGAVAFLLLFQGSHPVKCLPGWRVRIGNGVYGNRPADIIPIPRIESRAPL